MGQVILNEVIQKLKDGGIRTESAFPAGTMTRATDVVAAVSVDGDDREKKKTTILVEVIAPKELGGLICQTKATTVCDLLADMGAICRQENCAFLSKANAFRVPVYAEFGTNRAYTVVAGVQTLTHVCNFSAEQKKDGETVSIEELPWDVTIEEFFPWGTFNTLEPEEPFELYLQSSGGVENYASCQWTQRKRIAEEQGVRQIRVAVSRRRFLTGK